MKGILKLAFGALFGVVGCAGLSGCGDAEFELEDPKFEIGVEFDFHEVVFNYYGNVVTPEDEWPRIVPTFGPCYYKIVEKPEWVSIKREYGDGYEVGEGWWPLLNGHLRYPLKLECESNYSTDLRSGVVKVVVSNTYKDVPMGYIELDVPVYSFEGEFKVRQEGRAEEPYL